MQVLLSDDKPIEVRRLGIFELDDLTPEPYPPFTYKFEILGETKEAIFDYRSFDEPPPYAEKCEENDSNFDAYWNYMMYQAALLYESKKMDHVAQFNELVAKYILEHCVDEPNRIVEPEDWFKVYEAALVPQLTIEVIAKTLQKTYHAQFKGQDIFEALNDSKKGHGSYNQIKLWENKLMVEMQLNELDYSLLPLEERARKVCALFLPDVMSYLEIEEDRKHAEKVQDRKKTS